MPEKPGWLAQFKAVLQSALEDVASDSVENVKARISTKYPPASVEGEAPHLRTGKLKEGVHRDEAIASTGRIEVDIISDRAGTPNVPSVLENVLHRPYMSTERLYLEKMASKLIANALRVRLS
jgi:hypothetical protein